MITLKSEGEILVAKILGEIDHHTAREIREEIDTKIIRTTPSVLVLDFEKVTFMDSSGVGLIMGRYKLINPMGGRIIIKNSPDLVKRMLSLSGVSKLANIV